MICRITARSPSILLQKTQPHHPTTTWLSIPRTSVLEPAYPVHRPCINPDGDRWRQLSRCRGRNHDLSVPNEVFAFFIGAQFNSLLLCIASFPVDWSTLEIPRHTVICKKKENFCRIKLNLCIALLLDCVRREPDAGWGWRRDMHVSMWWRCVVHTLSSLHSFTVSMLSLRSNQILRNTNVVCHMRTSTKHFFYHNPVIL